MTTKTLLLASLCLIACSRPHVAVSDEGSRPSTLAVTNLTDADTVVYVAFGADSVVSPGAWSFCKGSGLVCNFALGKHASLALPVSGQYLNATFSFGVAVGCNSTKAEININNPGWYDTLDVSLVDGFSNKVSVLANVVGKAGVLLGPPKGRDGNEKVFGLFPYGCDVCVARQNPPCGISPGRSGCKSGSQYSPSVPCQYQGPSKKFGGQAVTIRLEN